MANLVLRRQFTVKWGHCDPAGIVFNSRFFEYFDWSVWRLFEEALAVKPNELARVFGIVGIPLVDAKARFLRPARFNDVAHIASEVTQFKRSSFEVTHRISIAGELAVEGVEADAFQQVAQREVVQLGQRLQHLQQALLHADAGLDALHQAGGTA